MTGAPNERLDALAGAERRIALRIPAFAGMTGVEIWDDWQELAGMAR